MGNPASAPTYAEDVSNPFAATPAPSAQPQAGGPQYAEDVSNPFDNAPAKTAPAEPTGITGDPQSFEQERLDAYDKQHPILGKVARYAVAGGNAILNAPSGIYHAVVDPLTPEEEQNFKGHTRIPGEVTAERLLGGEDTAKAIQDYSKGKVTTKGAASVLPEALGTGTGVAALGAVTEKAAGSAKAFTKGVQAGTESRIAGPIKATVPEAALQPDKAVAASDKIYQAVAPTKTDVRFRANVHAAAGDLAQVADKVDWDATRGGKGLTRESAPPDMRVRAVHDAVNDRMGEMYQTEVEPKIEAVATTPARLAPNPEAYSYLAQTAGDQATRELAAKAAKTPEAITVKEAYQLARTVNAELNNFERLDPAQQYQIRATNPGINKLNGLDEALNGTINGALKSRGLPGIQNFERRYAAMASVRRNIAGRMNEVELRRQGVMDRTVGKVAKGIAGRNVNAIASASAASLADVNVGDYLEKAFKNLKQSGVKPQLDAQPPAPKLTLTPPKGTLPGPRQEALGGTGMASSRSAAPEGVGDAHQVPGPPDLQLQPSRQMQPAAQRPFSFMDNENPNQSGPVYPGGTGRAPVPKTKTSGGTSVLSGEKPAPKASSASSSSTSSNNFKTFKDIDFSADTDNKALAQAKAEQAAGKLNGKTLVQRAQEIKEQLNGSGESEASLEAQRVAASDKAKGVNYYRVDTRSGVGSKLSGLRPEDLKPGPFEAIVKEHPDGTLEELSTGDKARRYNFKKPNQSVGKAPALSKPGLIRALSK